MNTDLEKYWQAYCNGDKKAFNNVFEIIFDSLFFRVLSFTKDRDLAKDIVQETLIKLYQNPDPSSIQNIKSWTYRVARNHFISNTRNAQSKKKFEDHTNKENSSSMPVDQNFTDKDVFFKVMKKYLSPSDFQVLELQMLGYPIPEIASKLNMQLKTVFNRRTKIRKVVAQIWKQLFTLTILLIYL